MINLKIKILMIDNQNQRKYDEEQINSKEYINDLNQNKISLRKFKNNVLLKRKREYLRLHFEEKTNQKISKEQQFNIINFDKSFNIINMYLASNNPDLIEYCLIEICNYFQIYFPKINEQKKIKETKFLNTLLYFGNKFINEKNDTNLSYILTIIINIQYFEERNYNYTEDLYSEEYFRFYNNCILYAENSRNNEYRSLIYKKIVMIFNVMAFNDNCPNYDLNLLLLRSTSFLNILNYLEEKNIKDFEEIKSIIELITFVVGLCDDENTILKKDDIKMIDKCLNILISELYNNSKEEILVKIYEGIRNISDMDDEYKLNKKIINEGVTLKILKMKFNNINPTENYIKIIQYCMMILANNLTSSDKSCQIIYDQNIIDYYNNILEKFDDNKKIVKYILSGLANISIGSNKEIIKYSIIWQEQRIIKYLSFNDEIVHKMIKIVKYFLYNANFESIQFIFNTNVLKYFMDLFVAGNIGRFISWKILCIFDNYLKLFKSELKETKEYLLIFNQYKDIFTNCEKVLLLRMENNDISDIEERIKNNYE
jgi:ribosomal protein S24E